MVSSSGVLQAPHGISATCHEIMRNSDLSRESHKMFFWQKIIIKKNLKPYFLKKCNSGRKTGGEYL